MTIKFNNKPVVDIEFNQERGCISQMTTTDGSVITPTNTRLGRYFLKAPRGEANNGSYIRSSIYGLTSNLIDRRKKTNVRVYDKLIPEVDAYNLVYSFVWLKDVQCYVHKSDERVYRVGGDGLATYMYFHKGLFEQFTDKYLTEYGLMECPQWTTRGNVDYPRYTRSIVILNCGTEISRQHPDIFRCEECCEYFYTDSMHCDEDSCCELCGDERQENRSYRGGCSDEVIESMPNNYYEDVYRNKVKSQALLGPTGEPRYFGVELEFEFASDDPLYGYDEDVEDLMQDNLLYVTEDGSLGYGAEFVSKPLGFLEFGTFASHFFDNDFVQSSLEVIGSCGMHVHVSRNSLTELTVSKLLNFFDNMDQSSLLDRICGRAPNEYCPRKKREASAYYSKVDKKFNSNKYAAINCVKDGTIEFRCFKSPVDKKEFLTRLEFVDALIKYVESSTSYLKPGDLSMLGLKVWLQKYGVYSKKRWPNLYAFVFGVDNAKRLKDLVVTKQPVEATSTDIHATFNRKIRKMARKQLLATQVTKLYA